MQTRKFDEMISYFNRKVSDMYIDRKYKMELLAMITAIGMAHEKELDAQLEQRWIPCSERLPDIRDIYIVLVDEKQLRPNESRVACAYWLDDKWQYGVLESYEHKMPKLVIEPLEELTVVAWMLLPEPYKGDGHAD